MISVVVATYGSEEWRERAQAAGRSAFPQLEGEEEIVYEHQPEGTVATSRNGGAEKAQRPWLLFLDADDELGPGFLRAMRRELESDGGGSPLLLTPAVSYVRAGRPSPPRLLPVVNYRLGNYLVIGTLVPRAFFFEIGGFADEPRYGAWEDWHFWARCLHAGARVKGVRKAVYRVNLEPTSRHRGVSNVERIRWHYEVGRDLFPEEYDEGWLAAHTRTAERLDQRVQRRWRR